MVQDIRPEATALLRQIANISQKKAGTAESKFNTAIMNRASRIEGNKPALKAHTNVNNAQQAGRIIHQKLHAAKRGRSVVEEVFNQTYSSSGFLEEQEVVPVKGEGLGTQIDVYA